MISVNECRSAQSDARLSFKTQDHALMRRSMEGAGLTRWEAQVLPTVVHDIYFNDAGARPQRDGQIRFQCVSLSAGAGLPLSECPLVSVTLTTLDLTSDREVYRSQGAVAQRRGKLLRITEEAREQGGVLTQEDLGVLLCCNERTVRRDIAALRAKGIHIATRGYLKDIGPTLTHKGLAIRHWLQGKEPVAVARAINHSLAAVERYLVDFRRVAFLAAKGLEEVAIARAANLSPALVKTYLGMVAEARATPAFTYRFEELLVMAGDQPVATKAGGKKGAP